MPTTTDNVSSAKRRFALLAAVVVLLIAGALVAWRGRSGKGWLRSWVSGQTEAASGKSGAALGLGTADGITPSLAPNRARPETGTGEAYLDHTYRGFIEAQPDQLGLTPVQANQLVNDLLEFQEVKADVVARFLRETNVEGDTVTVQVPPFPVEGKGMRDLLYQRLRKDFPDKAGRITAEIGGYVDETFEGFGLAEQTYVVKPGRLPGTFEVTWDARVPEGATPLREPDGTTYGGGSGVLLLSRDQIENGEYRFLTPVLARHFPAPTK